jgi:hypothetical protein
MGARRSAALFDGQLCHKGSKTLRPLGMVVILDAVARRLCRASRDWVRPTRCLLILFFAILPHSSPPQAAYHSSMFTTKTEMLLSLGSNSVFNLPPRVGRVKLHQLT